MKTTDTYCVDWSHWHVYPVPEFLCTGSAGTKLAQRMTDAADALDIDASWWRSQAEELYATNPPAHERYLGRAEGMEWGARAIRGDTEEIDMLPLVDGSVLCGVLWDGSEKPFRCGLPEGHDGQHCATYSTETATGTARWSDR